MIVGANIMDKIVDLIIDPLILFVFAAGMVLFMWGLVQFMRNIEGSKEEGKQHMLWGIIGMFIMVSVKGILQLSLDTFDIGVDNTPFGSGVQNARDAVDPFQR